MWVKAGAISFGLFFAALVLFDDVSVLMGFLGFIGIMALYTPVVFGIEMQDVKDKAAAKVRENENVSYAHEIINEEW